MNPTIKRIRDEQIAARDAAKRSTDRAARILAGQNLPARALYEDSSLYFGIRCPRRAGKTYALASYALWYGETHPGSRILIISLTLKSTKENYWTGAPAGIVSQNAVYDLGLTFNYSDVVWTHENGSRGRLAGAETRADIEYLRGAAAEADLAIVDECKSFSPDLMEALIRDVLEPGLMTRNGRLILAGTPGSIPMGKFYEATCPTSRIIQSDGTKGDPTCIPYLQRDEDYYRDVLTRMGGEDGSSILWSLHNWTIADNTSSPFAWRRAQANKKRNGWGNDHPTWRREYLGEWVTDALDLVYSYASCKLKGKDVNWRPQRDPRTNRSGLPAEFGPWHLVMGIDLGTEDDFAIVLAGWSETTQELRHVADFKSPHLLPDQWADEILSMIDTYGVPEIMVADKGALGKVLIDHINQQYGFSIIAAEKREKFDFIELLNGDFHAERIKIIPDTDLEHELCALQWDLSKDSKATLARTGRLKEDPSCKNHLCDAFLYLWRYCYHHWAQPREVGHEIGTAEWHREYERKQLESRLAQKRADRNDVFGFNKIRRRESVLTRDTPWNN